MKYKSLSAALALVAAATSGQAATVLSQGFDDVASLSGAGWAQVNNSVSPGLPWAQGNPGVLTAASGPANSFAAASFLSTNALSGAVSNWLILPTLALDSTSTISFMVNTEGAGFLDRIEVRFSPNGSSTDVGATTTSVGDFTSLLGSYQSSIATGWVQQSFSLGLTTVVSGRLAIRYLIDDVALNGNYLGIDDLTVTAVPEPATYALMALGVAGLLLRRRLSASATYNS